MKIFDVHQHICLPDVTGDLIVRYLDTNGIEKALVMGCPFWKHVAPNAIVRQAVKRHPDRLVGGAYVDPRAMVDAQETILEYHQDGFKCVKMYPCFGYYPDDESLFPVYALMEKCGMAMLCHSGGTAHDESSGPGSTAPVTIRTSYKYTLPWHYDTVAITFPRLNIILAHLGLSTFNLVDIFYLVSKHPNVYLDTSSTTAMRALKEVLRVGNQYIYPLDYRKLLWGRDGYGADEADAPSKRVRAEHELIKQLVQDETIREAIFYGNAAKLLQVES